MSQRFGKKNKRFGGGGGVIPSTSSGIGSADIGSERVLTDSFGKLVKSTGTEFREVAFTSSDQIQTSVKKISATGQVVFGKCKVVAITLISGSITELTLRDGLIQTYNGTDTVDPVIFTATSLTVGDRINVPADFYFGLHATVAGTTPVISLEVAA